MSEHSIEGFL